MIVRRGNFLQVLDLLVKEPRLSLDCETTGLRMFHGDKLFSLILSTADISFYFNFLPYYDLPFDYVLDPRHLQKMKVLFDDPKRIYFIHNAANFDLPMLGQEKIEIAGIIHCTKAIARIEYNEHQDYDLEACVARIGLEKSSAVEDYIKEHKLFEKVSVPGKKQKSTLKYFHRVPFDIITPYGERDGAVTFALGAYQEQSILEQDQKEPGLVASGRSLTQVKLNERRLQKTIYRMKSRGVLIDRPYCNRAISFETDRAEKASGAFKRETGRDYQASPNLFRDIFNSEQNLWSYTAKGNPSFDEDALKRMENPAAGHILKLRDAKAKADFYQGFLYHSDKDGVVHPDFVSEGTRHGRFASKNPNFQNLTNEDDENPEETEFLVRRAIIPRPGFIFIMPDYSQMEYKFMLEMACRLVGHATELSKLISSGMDFHDATGLNVTNTTGLELQRKQVKTVNFMTLYGSGIQNIADTLKIPFEQAKKIKDAILAASPEIKQYMKALEKTAAERGYIVNWFGRRCHFEYKSLAYKAPNYHVSGGCADVVKLVMNCIDEYLLSFKSRMVMTVHDELPIEVHESEAEAVPLVIKGMMESVFTSKYVPLTIGMKWSDKSLGDPRKGFPTTQPFKESAG